MNAIDRSLLLCTNGAPEGVPALTYGTWLAGVVQLPVTVLAVVERETERQAMEQVLSGVQLQLEAQGIAYSIVRREGRVREVLDEEAVPERHVVIIGPLGRPHWRHLIQGRSFRRLMPDLPVPLLYTSTAHTRLKRILVPTGALDYATSAECWALELARASGAAVTILHIVEAVRYHYPTSDQMEAHWKDLLKTDIPQARHLRALLEQAHALGVAATLQVLHGPVVHNVIAEARRGQFDLVVMGSKHSSHSLRRQYLPDVAAEVMSALVTPVLVVRSGQSCIIGD